MKRQTTSLHLVFLLILTGTLAFNTFIFPLQCLASFAGAALILFFLGRTTYVFDPTSGIWEGEMVPSKMFGSWAVKVTSPNHRKAAARFLRDSQLGVFSSLLLMLTLFRAWIYVHAVQVVAVLGGALLVLSTYEAFFAGHGLVWTFPVSAGVVIGTLWGYVVGLYWLWRRAHRAS